MVAPILVILLRCPRQKDVVFVAPLGQIIEFPGLTLPTASLQACGTLRAGRFLRVGT